MSNISNSTVVSPESSRRYPLNGVDYPLRFFNMMHFQRPKTLNEIFKWCIILNESHGLLDRLTDTMARYPITPIIVTNDIGEDRSFWSKLLNNTLAIQDELVKNGKDYYTFGNCIVTIVPPFKRYLCCPKCNTYMQHCINDDNEVEKNFDWKFRDYKFFAKCSKKDCGYNGSMIVKDEFLTGDAFLEKIKIHRWPIQFIKVRNLGIAGKKRIYYRIEDKYTIPIKKGDKFVVSNIPETFILACKANQNNPIIELPSDLTFHYEHEGITEPEWEGLSKPFFFSAWKDIFMSFVLRKAQECIASDHLIPTRFLFPSQNPGSGRDPLSQIDGGSWMNIITTQLKRQQNDPNEIGIVPFPIGYQALGGQGKVMSLREEIELQDRRILTQMGIPPELIYGGMTWSGSNISLRMLENLFLYYINKQNTFLRFFVKYAARMSGKVAPSEIKLKPFRMADDIQQMNLLSGLGMTGRISETTALSQISGIDLASEAKQMEVDREYVQRILAARQIANANVTQEITKITNNGQIENQAAGTLKQNAVGQSMQTSITDGFIATSVQGIVNKLKTIPYTERQAELRNLQINNPSQFNEVVSLLNGINPQNDIKPEPIVKGKGK